MMSGCAITKSDGMVKGILQVFFGLPMGSCLVVKYHARTEKKEMGKDSRTSREKKDKKGWWTRFLERLADANREALQQGCRS
jgi:hypothetical protein